MEPAKESQPRPETPYAFSGVELQRAAPPSALRSEAPRGPQVVVNSDDLIEEVAVSTGNVDPRPPKFVRFPDPSGE